MQESRSGGGREELGHSVKTSLALPAEEKVITISKIIILFNKIVCIVWPEIQHLL